MQLLVFAIMNFFGGAILIGGWGLISEWVGRRAGYPIPNFAIFEEHVSDM